MDQFGISNFTQQEHIRFVDRVNNEAWKFEHIEQPSRGRMKLATLRQRLGR